ncbi:MAG: hypothetical protein RMJ31_00880 [Nitrososphaerota archaeon]|nr:hypothetical protein [Nitrososphaerales archaeon]MDW8044318.1 hypothetical protein [Nitrososphaerota archaeon]
MTKHAFKITVLLSFIVWLVAMLSFPILKNPQPLIIGIPFPLLYLWSIQIVLWILGLLAIYFWLKMGE